MKKNSFLAFTLLGLFTLLYSCKLDPAFFSDGLVAFTIHLQGGPSDFDEVNIDLQVVDLLLSSDDNYKAHTEKGIYNLKKLDGDNLELIVLDTLPSQIYIEEITLLLGNRNTIKTQNQLFFLEADSGSFNVKVNAYLSAERSNDILLNIDVRKSIQVQDTGKFFLKPIITASSAE